MKNALSFAAVAATFLASSHAFGLEQFKTVKGVGWELKTPNSTSLPEREQAALDACEAKIAENVRAAAAVLEGSGITVTYRNVAIDSRYGDWSKTKKGIDGVGKHTAGGVADCSYYQVTSGL